MAKKAPAKKAAAKKAPAKKAAAKKAPATPGSVIALHNQHPTDAVVLSCIRAQSGGATLTPNAQLGSLGVNGFDLAACINSRLGTTYTAENFPPTMTVAQCVLLVRATAPH